MKETKTGLCAMAFGMCAMAFGLFRLLPIDLFVLIVGACAVKIGWELIDLDE